MSKIVKIIVTAAVVGVAYQWKGVKAVIPAVIFLRKLKG